MKLVIPRLLLRVIRLVLLLLLGAFLMAVVGLVLFMNNQPDLRTWHTVELTEEFTEDSAVDTFEEYLALEERLFAQLETELLDPLPSRDRRETNRFHRGSWSDPGRWPRDWNRTFELPVEAPKAGVLLLHGMSDSPYSLRSQGERLHAAGAWVVGLRIPGHGTAPSGLLATTWEDMAAAVRLATAHIAAKVGDRPLYIVGYSNGASLAVHYALESLVDETRPRVSKLVLLSPAIGITPAAALAIWQERIGKLLGLSKLAWNSVGPEYDPFKYQSFTVNAAVQTYRLTREISRLIDRRAGEGVLGRFPPVLAFQSGVDATVSTTAVVTGLFKRLPGNGHELVLFDVHRTAELDYLLVRDPRPGLRALLGDVALEFTLTVVTNREDESEAVVVRSRGPGTTVAVETPLDLDWPADVFSLTHVSIPIAPDDPLYGHEESEDGSRIQLGSLALRGERGVLAIPSGEMLRQRWNPFHAWQQERMVGFLGF